jgi:hypothetical protein
VAKTRNKNPLGYFRTILRETCQKNGRDFEQLVRQVPVPEGVSVSTPETVVSVADILREKARA